ncbi:MAG: alpha/beta hydrolase, partial [Anaerolineae bacterium]
MRTRKRWAWLLLLVPLLAIGGFAVWAYTPLGPMPEALAALQSGAEVQVKADPWLVFKPAGDEPTTGLVLYPGGRVDPRSYAPAARAIAAEGHVVVIVPMPFNLAVTGAGRAADVISAFPQVERWAVGGHSLGGAMASR